MDKGQIESIKNELSSITEQLSKSHKSKKSTKKEFINEQLPKLIKEKLKESHIKGLVQGFEVANQMLLDYIKDGHTMDELINFASKNVINSEVVEKIAKGELNVERS
jgi:hypothetical protein